jgi:hypothetical protein
MGQLISDKVVLCKLEDGLRIAAKGNCFILQERVCDIDNQLTFRWKDRYYYGWLGGVLRGYVLYSLKRFARVTSSADINKLIEQIERLDMDINNLDITVNKLWHDCTIDPVEAFVNDFIANDPIEKVIAEYNITECRNGL